MGAKPQATEKARSSLELLYSIGRQLTAQLDPRLLLQRILELTIDSVGAASGSIVVLDEDGAAVDGALIYGGELHDQTAEQLSDTVAKGLAGWVVANREGVLIESTLNDPRWLSRPREEESGESRSAISVPLLLGERVVGVLTLVHPKAGHLTREDLELLTAIADMAGVAVENARLYAAEQEKRRLASTLQEIARIVNSVLDPVQVFAQVLDQLKRVIQFDSASVLMVDGDHLRVVAASGFDDEDAVLDVRLPIDQDLLSTRALKSGEPIVVADVHQEAGWLTSDEAPESHKIHGWIGVPLVVRGRAVGVLSVDSHEIGTYGPKDLAIVSAFADQAATAVVNAQLFAETQKARQRYTDLFEDSIDPILISDLSGKVTEANHRAELFLGYDREELLGRSVLSLHVPTSGGLPEGLFEIEPGQIPSYEARATHKEGYPIPVEINVKRIDLGNRPVLQWILRDITERVELDELRGDLTSMIFHDLRAPLGNVISSLDVLKASLSPDDAAALSVTAIAQRSSRRLSRLIDSLLDLGRLEAGQDVLRTEEGSIPDLIQESIEEVKPTSDAKGHSIEVEIGDDIPVVTMDTEMIRRVVINLLDNAIKYTRHKGRIRVSARREGNEILVSVRDNGPGVSEKEQGTIFDKFTRVPFEGRPKGLGLGLAFCRLAVEAHGGRIWLESQPGEGSTFSFALPIS